MELFDSYASQYRETHDKNLHLTGLASDYFAEKKVRVIAAEKDTKVFYRILDIGCGDGKIEEYMVNYFHNYEIIGIDISEESIKIAQKKRLQMSQFNVYDGTTIPYKDNMFDIVILSGVLHHVDKDAHPNLLREICRVMKYKASFILFEHNPWNPFTRYIVNTCIFDKGVVLIPHKYSQNLLIKSGLGIQRLRFTSFFPNKFLFKYMIPYEYILANIPWGGQYYIHAVK